MADRKTAVVVGASSGIGEALAREFADRGDDVGLTARRRERLVAGAIDLIPDAGHRRVFAGPTVRPTHARVVTLHREARRQILYRSIRFMPETQASHGEHGNPAAALPHPGFKPRAPESEP